MIGAASLCCFLFGCLIASSQQIVAVPVGLRGRADELSLSQIQMTSKATPGILCPTFLHPAIHEKQFLRFAKSAMSEALALDFDEELKQLCEKYFPNFTWPEIWSTYSGAWDRSHIEQEDNLILGSLASWLKQERIHRNETATSLQEYIHQDNESMLNSVQVFVSHPTALQGIRRVLDFGCGDGIEALAVGRGFNLSRDNIMCLDVTRRLAPEVEDHITLLEADPSDYDASLNSYLVQYGGSVTVAYASVVFHHIADASMRRNALGFIRRVLEPGGIFILGEWDNALRPIDFSVFFDLCQYLPALFFADATTTKYNITPRATSYLPIDRWVEVAEAEGFKYDRERSQVPVLMEGAPANTTADWYGSQWMADTWLGRTFFAVFTTDRKSVV